MHSAPPFCKLDGRTYKENCSIWYFEDTIPILFGKRKKAKKLVQYLGNAFAVFVTLGDDVERVAVIEFDSTIDSHYIELDGKGDECHTTITVFKPDVYKDGVRYDNFYYFRTKNGNSEI